MEVNVRKLCQYITVFFFFLLQEQIGVLRTVLCSGQCYKKVRRAALRVSESHVGYPRHRTALKLCLQGHRLHTALRLPRMATSALGEPLCRSVLHA